MVKLPDHTVRFITWVSPPQQGRPVVLDRDQRPVWPTSNKVPIEHNIGLTSTIILNTCGTRCLMIAGPKNKAATNLRPVIASEVHHLVSMAQAINPNETVGPLHANCSICGTHNETLQHFSCAVCNTTVHPTCLYALRSDNDIMQMMDAQLAGCKTRNWKPGTVQLAELMKRLGTNLNHVCLLCKDRSGESTPSEIAVSFSRLSL